MTRLSVRKVNPECLDLPRTAWRNLTVHRGDAPTTLIDRGCTHEGPALIEGPDHTLSLPQS